MTPAIPPSAWPTFSARVVRGRILLISCLDNLVKGAAGAAVQNFNVLFGLPEQAGLL